QDAVIPALFLAPGPPAHIAKSPVAVVMKEVIRRALQPLRAAHHPLTAILAIAASDRISRSHAANVFSFVLFLAGDDSAGSRRRQGVQVDGDITGEDKSRHT